MERKQQTNICSKFTTIDAFGKPVQWLQPGSQATHNSAAGALCTIIVYATLLLYASYRLLTLY